MVKTVDTAYYQLLHELQAVDFVLVELTLYLDTHPMDPHALRQFNRLSQERQELARRFESAYGPLLHYGHSLSREPWEWSQSPWPWQI